MSEPVALFPTGAPAAAGEGSAPRRERVFFSRRELEQILQVYGRMVAAGHWRDYAMGDGAESAVFAVFRRTAEFPIYRIEKRPALARRQGAWSVIAAGGRIVKRGGELEAVLRYFDRKLLKPVD